MMDRAALSLEKLNARSGLAILSFGIASNSISSAGETARGMGGRRFFSEEFDPRSRASR